MIFVLLVDENLALRTDVSRISEGGFLLVKVSYARTKGSSHYALKKKK